MGLGSGEAMREIGGYGEAVREIGGIGEGGQ